MTLFLEIAKKFLGEEITLLHNASLQADNSVANIAVKSVGFGRDAVLAKEKRELLNTLKVRLTKLEDNKNDDHTLQEIKKLILDFRTRGIEKSQEREMDPGSYGHGLQRLEILAQLFYDKINKLKLLDIPADNSPLNIFRLSIATHAAYKELAFEKASALQRVLSHPSISNARPLEKKKEEILMEHLSACISEIEEFDKGGERYHAAVKRRVEERIGMAQEAIRQLEANQQYALFKSSDEKLFGYLFTALIDVKALDVKVKEAKMSAAAAAASSIPANHAPAGQAQAPADQAQAPADQAQAPAGQAQAPADQAQAPANQAQQAGVAPVKAIQPSPEPASQDADSVPAAHGSGSVSAAYPKLFKAQQKAAAAAAAATKGSAPRPG